MSVDADSCAQLFVGTLTSTYSLWDIFDDCIRNPSDQCDASKLSQQARSNGFCLCFCVSSTRVLGCIWWLISAGLIVAAICCGILAFPESRAQQNKDSNNFIDASPSS